MWNSQNIIELVGKNSSNTRLFSFGIGCGASTALVKGVARAGRGKAEFVNENEINKLPQKVNITIPTTLYMYRDSISELDDVTRSSLPNLYHEYRLTNLF